MLDLTGPDLTGGVPEPSRTVFRLRTPESVLARENFPVASRLLPTRYRRHLLAVYRYARLVDDLGDEPAADGGRPGTADRLAGLDHLEAELRGLYQGRSPGHPVLAGLAVTVTDCRIPADPLLRLIAANRQDQVVTRYPDFASLVDYCHLSADPVGELVLRVFAAYTPDRCRYSDRICTALQLVEHLQDVAEDYRRGRIYLPVEDLLAHQVTERDLAATRAGESLRRVVHQQADRAGALFDSGAPLVGELRGWARLAVAGYLAGGRAALVALARHGHDPLPGPPRASRRLVAGHWLRALLGRHR